MEKFKKRQDIRFRKLDDEGILFDPATNTVHVLNPTSELIWNYCDGEHDFNGITHEILKKYRVERNQAEKDVNETLRQFKQLQLVEENSHVAYGLGRVCSI